MDCYFGPITDPIQLATRMDARSGIVEHSLFLGSVTDVIVADDQGIRHLRSGSHGIA